LLKKSDFLIREGQLFLPMVELITQAEKGGGGLECKKSGLCGPRRKASTACVRVRQTIALFEAAGKRVYRDFVMADYSQRSEGAENREKNNGGRQPLMG
jgi:hypothetical protein